MSKLWFRWRNLKKRSLLLTSSIVACMVIAYTAMTAIVRGDGVIVSISPSSQNIPAPGTTFQLNITITGVPTSPDSAKLWSWSIKVTWNPAVLNCTAVDEGPFLSDQASPTFFLASPPDNVNGEIDQITDTSMKVPTSGAGGSGVLAILTFLSTAQGSSNITILNPDFMDVSHTTIPVTVENGEVIVIPEFPVFAIIPVFLITTAAIAIIARISRPRRRLDYTKAP